jgi:hypothetical protein
MTIFSSRLNFLNSSFLVRLGAKVPLELGALPGTWVEREL